MKNLWIVPAGVCGILVMVGVVRYFHRASSDSPEVEARRRSQAAAGATAGVGGRSERSGWTARTGGSAGDPAGGGSGSAETGLGTEAGQVGGGGSAVVIGGGSRAGAGSAAGVGRSGSGSIEAQVNVPASSGSFPKGGLASRENRRKSAGTDGEQLVPKDDKAATDAAMEDDPNAPVLSVPFDKTTEPEKGADQPEVDEQVQCGGVGEGCVFDTDSRYAIPDAGNLSGEAGSISFCLQPQWGGGDPSNAGLVDLETPNVWENRLKIFKNGEYFRFSIWPSTGAESGVSARINNWQAGQWHPVTVTFGPDPQSGQNMASMYVDGQLVGQQPYDGQLQVPRQPLYIGSGIPGGEPTASGALKNFQAYNRVIMQDEASSFASGCPQ